MESVFEIALLVSGIAAVAATLWRSRPSTRRRKPVRYRNLGSTGRWQQAIPDRSRQSR